MGFGKSNKKDLIAALTEENKRLSSENDAIKTAKEELKRFFNELQKGNASSKLDSSKLSGDLKEILETVNGITNIYNEELENISAAIEFKPANMRNLNAAAGKAISELHTQTDKLRAFAEVGVSDAPNIASIVKKLNENDEKQRDRMVWYEAMLDSIPFPISVTDMNMNWTFINKPVEQMLKLNRNDVIGKHCSNWGAGICNTENCGISCLRKNKNITNFEQFNMSFQVNSEYLLNRKGEKIGHIEVVQDITPIVSIQKEQSDLLAKVSESSTALLEAARNIENGSRSVAEGSNEQLTSISKVSDAITELSNQTSKNAEMVVSTTTLTEKIKSDAEKGSMQMEQMTKAVNEVNEASVSINKIIKVIEDIAFQTNLLALNAAVEAARAGEHGKGFAVVAEEVRNLAVRSQTAANETTTLIHNSIEKAKNSAELAENTSKSFEGIVNGIQESSRNMGSIAESSSLQNATIALINTDIENIARVANSNASTSQESAAASIELSAHSNSLKELLNK